MGKAKTNLNKKFSFNRSWSAGRYCYYAYAHTIYCKTPRKCTRVMYRALSRNKVPFTSYILWVWEDIFFALRKRNSAHLKIVVCKYKLLEFYILCLKVLCAYITYTYMHLACIAQIWEKTFFKPTQTEIRIFATKMRNFNADISLRLIWLNSFGNQNILTHFLSTSIYFPYETKCNRNFSIKMEIHYFG